MIVEQNDFRRRWAVIRRDALSAFARVGASGSYILGPEVGRFEEMVAAAWPTPYVVGVASGLDAIEIALRSLGIAHGDRVMTTPLSAFATSLALIRVGAMPVFVDVDGQGLIDLDLCREVLSRDPRIRWFLPVHLYGQLLDLSALCRLRDMFGLTVVEDCAQSIGAARAGSTGGTVGAAAATSFYPTKNLGALGDAGAVLTRSHAIAEKARALRHYGQSSTYVHDYIGMNSRLDEIHAAIMTEAMLPRLSEWTARRTEIAHRYQTEIRNDGVSMVPLPAGSSPAWHLFPILVTPGHRKGFVEHLRARGVIAGLHYPTLIPDQPAMKQYGTFIVATSLSNAVRFARGEISLPIHPFLTEPEVDHVIAACNSWRIQ